MTGPGIRTRGIRTLAMMAAALLAASPALAEGPFSEGSEAASWNLFGEEKARFRGRAVDALCALTGDCPADCGGGARQMGILRAADGAFVLAAKNAQPLFTGATVDLAAFCGMEIEVDGLLVGDPAITPGLGAQVYQVQTVRVPGGDTVHEANLWTERWAERFPDAPGEGQWFERDPRVREEIAEHGYLGLGRAADEAFAEENF